VSPWPRCGRLGLTGASTSSRDATCRPMAPGSCAAFRPARRAAEALPLLDLKPRSAASATAWLSTRLSARVPIAFTKGTGGEA
jgi:hypothetical protein